MKLRKQNFWCPGCKSEKDTDYYCYTYEFCSQEEDGQICPNCKRVEKHLDVILFKLEFFNKFEFFNSDFIVKRTHASCLKCIPSLYRLRHGDPMYDHPTHGDSRVCWRCFERGQIKGEKSLICGDNSNSLTYSLEKKDQVEATKETWPELRDEEEKKLDFSWQSRPEKVEPIQTDFGQEPQITDKKEPLKSKYDNKENLIKRIEELETEIRQLKAEKVEKDELPKFQIVLEKKELELKANKEKLLKIAGSNKDNPGQKKNKFPVGLVAGGIGILVVLSLLVILIIGKSKKEK